MKLLYEHEGYELIGAAMEVYNEMGPGFLKEVYQECIELELDDRKIPFQAQVPLELWYKGKKMKKRYKWLCLLYAVSHPISLFLLSIV